MYEQSQTVTYPIEQTIEMPWYADTNTLLSIAVGYALICGLVTLFIAVEHKRSWFLGFLSGFFLGQMGIVAYMIMGERN